MDRNKTVCHVRGLHSTDARKFVRGLNDVDLLRLIRSGVRRSTVREAVEGRIHRLNKTANPRQWKPTERDATIRDALDREELHTCSACKRDLPIGDGVDEIGVRRKRNLVRDGVEYVICAQSRCRRCQREYSKQRTKAHGNIGR